MARLLCVVLLLAAVAVADDYTVYNCGVTPSLSYSFDRSNPDDCKVRAKIESVDMGTCFRKTEKYHISGVSVEKYECQATGVAELEEVEDYEVKSRCSKVIDIDKSEKKTTTTTTTTTAESKKDSIHSAKLTKSGNTYTLITCSGGAGCPAEDEAGNMIFDTKPCAKYTIDVKKDSCTKSGDIYYKVREVTKGNELYWIELYSASNCKAESIVLQGELLANDKSCTSFSPQTLYSCNAPAYYTTRSCGLVNSCGDCEDLTMHTKAFVNKCKNTTRSFSSNSSTMMTCSDGKVSTLTYTSDSCETEIKQTSTTESCFFTGRAQYVKLTESILYICSTPKQCRSARTIDHQDCTVYPLPSKINITGDCKLETGANYEYSYKATPADNAYRIALYNSRKCETNLVLQGKFAVGWCQMVRPAQKTECSSGSLAASALLAVSVMSAVLSMLF